MKDSKSLQPEINLGLVGHVDHGKTTLTEKLSGRWTDTHSEELKRGITIRLGYADVVIKKCTKCGTYAVGDKCECGEKTELVRKISLVDAPGHESLMATMLSGATIMDGAILMVAANETCPQPQTREHMMDLEIMGLKNIIIVQNKIDLVSKERAKKNYHEIKEFIKNSPFKDAPIVPISAQHGVNIDVLIKTIEEIIPTPKRDSSVDPIMYIARSFDVNKPGAIPKNLVGGILGGTLARGEFKDGDEIELRPGRIVVENNQQVAKPLITKIIGLKTGGNSVEKVGPGGSIGVLTSLDMSIVKSDKLTGNVAGYPGKLPPIWYDLKLKTNLLDRVVGSAEDINVGTITMGEILMLNINSASTVGIVNKIGKNEIECKLKLPICADIDSRITISRRVGTRFRLIGYGLIQE
jgi:translation initiation factor 2 subunit 3